MSRVLKVFGSADERKQLVAKHGALADYSAFSVIELSDGDAERLARKHLVEDITAQYKLPMGVPDAPTAGKSVARIAGRAQAAPKSKKSLGKGRHHYIVQFVGPIKQRWLVAVRKAGGEPRAPYQSFAYIVRADAKQLRAITALPFVRWTGHLPYKTRVAQGTRRRSEGGSRAAAVEALVPRTRIRPGVYTVQFFGPDDLKKGLSKVKNLGFKVLDRTRDSRLLIVESTKAGSTRAAQIDKLAAVHGVQQIRERSIKRTSNDVAAKLVGAIPTTNPSFGLSGKGEVICVCDTGIDTGDPTTIHPDFTGRIEVIRSFPITPDYAPFIHNPGADDGPTDRDSGHGTHVAGSVLGDGLSSIGLPGLIGRIRGLSHEAKLVFQAVEQELDWKNPADEEANGRFVLAGIPADLAVLLQHAYTHGARIHSNSWNGGDPGEYDAHCEQLDRFVWNHKDMCVLVAAGNDGTDSDGDGVINPLSVTAPSTAKNCITVGASENKRPTFNGETYGEWWPDDYPSAPFHSAPMADNPGHIVAFSSRGPTADGRFKPEVLAPGTFVLSTRSRRIALNNKAWAAYPPSNMYFHMGGTSMATPVAAGAVGMLREHLRKKRVAGGPTAALLKAMLIASAVRLKRPGPRLLVDNEQGYGLINLASVLRPSESRKAKADNVSPGLKTGEAWSRTVRVTGAVPLRVVLAYSDYPGQALVNNLNLMLHSPDGTVYLGNQADAGSAIFDTGNNVEMVEVLKAKAGEWRIEVIGSNVPQGPQDFAIVTVGRLS